MRSLSLIALLVGLLASSDYASAKVPRVAHPHRRPHSPRALKQFNELSRRAVLGNRATSSSSSSSKASIGWQYKAPTTKAPKKNVWRSLTDAEAASVINLLHGTKWLNLTASDDATSWDNSITVVETLTPNKTDVVPYLTSQKGSHVPERWAKATIMFGATEEPYLEDFQIGPLPVSNRTTITPLVWSSTKGSSKQRNYDADSDANYEFMLNVTASVQDIVKSLFNGTATGSDDDTLDIWGIDPLWHINGRVIEWVGFWGIPSAVFDGETLLPQGLYFQLDITGRDPAGWSVLGWLHNGIYYENTAAFRAAWERGEVKKLKQNTEGAWIGEDWAKEDLEHADVKGGRMELDKKPPPMQVQPGGEAGLRYKVDVENQYVEWMDFSFYITFSRDTGMRLFDVKYKGDRILYEFGLEEAIAHYAGNDPVQSGTAYLDTYYGFGPYAFELLPGYDCPLYATYLNSTFHADELSKTHRNSICLFEADQNYGMVRHSSMNYVTATKNIAFTVRSISTVGNYDYEFDYTFYLDGTIENSVRASGYIQSAYYAQNGEYGYQIHEGLSGSMHDHSLNFKADFDILGTANSFAQHSIVAKDIEYPWTNGTKRSTMHLERSYIDNEDDAKLMWPENAQSMLMVVNKNETNKFGEPRGYRIMPGRGGGMRLTITNSSNLLNSQSFATHHLYVTKQKDTEPHSAHANNNYDTANPIVDFSKFFDSESLDQEDLVVWYNLGMHHVPHTGDLPNTVFTTAQSSMMISPHNYLYNDPSRSSRQTVRVNYQSETGVSEVITFGQENPKGSVNLTTYIPDFSSYLGDVAVRKFPYDPQHPFNDTESIV